MASWSLPSTSTAGNDVPYHRPHRKRHRREGPIPMLGNEMTREQQFLSERALIERVVAWVCARHGLHGADAEDFSQTVMLRLIENDYAVLGRFEGRSALKTYLTAVIQHLYLDFQTQRFGKWRSSAQARRLGPVALRLEALLYRDGLTFDEARGVLQTNVGVTESRDALDELSRKLPVRGNRRDLSRPDHERAQAGSASSTIEQAERQDLARKTFVVLRRALWRLPARDRIVVRLHIEGGLPLAEVARSLGEDQKALYRKRDALLKQLRAGLEREGLRGEDVQELLATLDWDAALEADGAGGGSCQEKEGEP